MSEILRLKMQQFQESQNRKHNMDMRKLRTEHRNKFHSEVKRNEAQLEQMRESYQTKINHLEAKLHKKIVDLRKKHKTMVAKENKRLAQELKELRKAHQSKRYEIQESQHSNIESLLEDHKRILKTAEQKFEKEKTRLDS